MTSETQTPKLGIGVIGTSPFTQRFHLDSLKGHPVARLVAICGRNPQRAREVATRYGIPHLFTDYRELVRCPEVEAVVVVTPNYLHHPMSMATLEAGKHLLCEKPLGMNLAEVREMYERAEAAGVIHMTNFTNRGLPAAIRAKQLVEEGYVGKVYHLFISVLTSLHREEVMTWRRDRGQAGTGVLGDIGSHMIDLARWLVGEIARVAAHLSTVAPRLRLPDSGELVDNETDDSCALLLEFQGGAQGLIHVSWVAHAAVGGAHMRVELHGSEGMLLIDRRRGGDPRSWVTVWGARRQATSLEPLPMPPELVEGLDLSSEESLVRTLNNKPFYAARRFVEAVLGNREMSPSLYDGMRVQAVIDAAVESDRRGAWVEVP